MSTLTPKVVRMWLTSAIMSSYAVDEGLLGTSIVRLFEHGQLQANPELVVLLL